MPDIPEGRCSVCRAAWEPCRPCKGKVRRAKCEATMAANGTQRNQLPRGQELRWGRTPDSFRHQAIPKITRRKYAEPGSDD